MIPIDAFAYSDGGLTPIEKHRDIWMKRDDMYLAAGAPGGKARTCWQLAGTASKGLVTAGSRSSPQLNIVARIAKYKEMPSYGYCPSGKDTPEIAEARYWGMEIIVVHPGGYNNVIIARAKNLAGTRNMTYIPFGMECETVQSAMLAQAMDIPQGVKRIVMPVGSAMSLAGVLHALQHAGRAIPVVGVVVGANPYKRLDSWAPFGWRDMATLISSGSDYHKAAPITSYDGVALDPHYEAKCLPFLQPSDLLWVVGIRSSAMI